MTYFIRIYRKRGEGEGLMVSRTIKLKIQKLIVDAIINYLIKNVYFCLQFLITSGWKYQDIKISRHLRNTNYHDLTHSSSELIKMNSHNLNNCFCNKWLADLGRSLVQVQSRHLCLVAQLVAHPTANGNQSFITIIILFKLRFSKVHSFFGAPTQGTCFRDVLVFLTPR